LAGNEALKVFFDSQATSANYQLPELLVAAKRSALFLVVGSPSYAARNWPHQELETFVEQSPDLSRLFMIECMPLNDGEQYPAPLDRRIHVPFWKPSGPKRIGMPISPASDDFSTLVHGLASDIRERLLLILHSGSG
jgi:hypothetical protein